VTVRAGEHSLTGPDRVVARAAPATPLRLTERYCVVLQTLTGGVPVTVTRRPAP
jgi:hypothetical protein